MRDARIRLQDILFAIEQIEKYRARGRAAFDGDELIQVWMVHHQYDLEQLLGCRVEVVAEQSLKMRMREEVLREAAAL